MAIKDNICTRGVKTSCASKILGDFAPPYDAGAAERMERVAETGGDWPAADQDFHLSIIRASHNEYMRRLYPIINDAVSEILQISENRRNMQEMAVADNRLILDFLLRRDAAGARYAMSIHMKHLIQTLRD